MKVLTDTEETGARRHQGLDARQDADTLQHASISEHCLQDGARLRHGIFPPTPELMGELSEDHVSLYLGPKQCIVSTANGRRTHAGLSPGDISVAPRGLKFTISWPQSAEFVTLVGAASAFAKVAEDLGVRGALDLRLIDRVRDPHLELLLRSLHEDTMARSPSGPLYQNLLVLALATRIVTNFGSVPVRIRKYKASLPHSTLRRVTDYIEDRIDHSITLAELASAANLSPHYFCEIFRRTTGQSPHQYVLQRRIERAKALASDPECTLTQIAYRTGFSSQAHFTGIFRRFVGATPGQYRAWQQNSRRAHTATAGAQGQEES